MPASSFDRFQPADAQGVVLGRGDDASAIGREAQGADSSGVAVEDEERLAGGDVPQGDVARLIAGRERPSIGREGDGVHLGGAAEAVEQLAGGDLPDASLAVPAGGGGEATVA